MSARQHCTVRLERERRARTGKAQPHANTLSRAGSLAPRSLLDLQRIAGNQAVNQLLRQYAQQRAAPGSGDAFPEGVADRTLQSAWHREGESNGRERPNALQPGQGAVGIQCLVEGTHPTRALREGTVDTAVGMVPALQRAPAAPAPAEAPSTTELWSEVSGAYASFYQQLGGHATPNSDRVGRLGILWAQVGGPGEKSDAELRKLRDALDALKKEIAEEGVLAKESWKVDTDAYREERKNLESEHAEWGGDAIKILDHQYEDTARVVQIAGEYVALDDLVPLEHMLKDKRHREHARARAERAIERPATLGRSADAAGWDESTPADPSDLLLPAGMEATDIAALRDMYVQGSQAIRDEAHLMLSRGADATEVANWAVDARNTLKARIRTQGARIIAVLAEARNRGKYSNPLGKSAEEMRAEGKTNAQILEKVGEPNSRVTRWTGRLRIAGRIMIAVDIGVSVYRIATASDVDRPRVLLEETGRLAGAVAGAEGGAEVGGGIGVSIGEWFGPEGAAIGGGIGAFFGGIIGGIEGARAGRTLAGFVASELYPPAQTGLEGTYEFEGLSP